MRLRSVSLVALLALAMATNARAADPVFGLLRVEAKQNIRHAKVSAIADGADTTIVRPSDWNADHNDPPLQVMSVGGGVMGMEWSSQPAGLTELFNDSVGINRTKADLTYVSQVRLVVYVITAGSATAKLRVQYSTDGSTWAYADGTSGPSVDISSTGLKVSGWVTLAGAANADVFLRVVGIDG